MKTTGTQRLLEKAVAQVGNRYRVAKALEMDPSNFSRALAGKLHLGPRPAILLAELLDLDALDVLAVTQADAARRASDREWWHRRVPRFLRAFGLAVLVTGSLHQGPNVPGQEPIYIMRSRRRAA